MSEARVAKSAAAVKSNGMSRYEITYVSTIRPLDDNSKTRWVAETETSGL